MTWSLGCTTDLEGRVKFNNKVREMAGKDNKFIQPKEGLLYDYCFYLESEVKEWRPWLDTIKRYEIKDGARFSDVIVPT